MDNKEYQVYITPAANNRMARHIKFLAKINENSANRLLNDLMAGIRSLKEMPFRNSIYNRRYLPRNKYRSLIINRRYVIVYQISGNFVYVDDIQDWGQSDDKNLL